MTRLFPGRRPPTHVATRSFLSRWFPLIVLGATLFWTAALGLGSLSLGLLAELDGLGGLSQPDCWPLRARDEHDLALAQPLEEAIPVHLQEETHAETASPPPLPPPQDDIGRTAY